MKKVLYGLSLIILTLGGLSVSAQNIIDSEDDNNLSRFYSRKMTQTKQAMTFVRNSTNSSISRRARTPYTITKVVPTLHISFTNRLQTVRLKSSMTMN